MLMHESSLLVVLVDTTYDQGVSGKVSLAGAIGLFSAVGGCFPVFVWVGVRHACPEFL